MKSEDSLNSNRLFVVVVIVAIIFGFGGYWYGSRNPGGFAVGPNPVNDVLNIDQEPARDHPGSVTMNTNSALQQYKNTFIGLEFQFPMNFVARDVWLGDSTDLLISVNSDKKQAELGSDENNTGGYGKNELEISYYATMPQFDYQSRSAQTLDDWIQKYSTDSTDSNENTAKAIIKNPQQVSVGNLSGYQAEVVDAPGNKVYFINSSRGYFQIVFRPDDDMSDEVQNDILSNLNFS